MLAAAGWQIDRWGATYATVCTVCAAALLWCLVDLDVLYDKVTGIEALGIGVGLSVLEETEKELGRLDGPASAGDTESLACKSSVPSSAKNIPATKIFATGGDK